MYIYPYRVLFWLMIITIGTYLTFKVIYFPRFRLHFSALLLNIYFFNSLLSFFSVFAVITVHEMHLNNNTDSFMWNVRCVYLNNSRLFCYAILCYFFCFFVLLRFPFIYYFSTFRYLILYDRTPKCVLQHILSTISAYIFNNQQMNISFPLKWSSFSFALVMLFPRSIYAL